jgi:hypothetical protein
VLVVLVQASKLCVDLWRRRGVTWCAQATTSRQTPEKTKRRLQEVQRKNRLSPKGGQHQESHGVRDMIRGSAGRTASSNTRSVDSMLEVQQTDWYKQRR